MKLIILDQPLRVGAWVMGRMGADWHPSRGEAIGLEREGELIAGVVYESYNGASVICHTAAIPGGHWMTPAYLRTIFSYPFNQLGCKKLICPVGQGNMQSRRYVENLGFTLEATLEDAHPDGALLVYTLARDACRWNHPRRPRNGKTLRTETP